MNVYQVNDFDCVVAHDTEEAREWYLKEYELDDEYCYPIDEIEMRSLDDEMWVELEMLSEEQLESTPKDKIEKGAVWKTYRWVMKNLDCDKQVPYLISSTE